MRTRTRIGIGLIAALSTWGLSGCGGDGGGGGTGTLLLQATDAPFAPDQVEEAVVHVTKIRVKAQTEDDSGFITLFHDVDEPIVLDLTQLRNGLTQRLADAELPAGLYSQIRLEYGDAWLKLKNGNEYSTADGTLKLTSQASSGQKIFPEPPIEVRDGLIAYILLDYDLTKTFRPLPASQGADAPTFLFGPVIRTADLLSTGEIRGEVVDGLGEGVVGAAVYLLPEGETDLEKSLTSTVTEADGHYVLLGIDPGTYDLRAVKETLVGSESSVIVQEGSITFVDLTVE